MFDREEEKRYKAKIALGYIVRLLTQRGWSEEMRQRITRQEVKARKLPWLVGREKNETK